MAINRLPNSQGGGRGQSRLQHYRSDTRGIQALLNKQLNEDKSIGEAERLTIRNQAIKNAEGYVARKEEYEFKAVPGDDRGTLLSHLTRQNWVRLTTTLTEGQRLDAEAAAKNRALNIGDGPIPPRAEKGVTLLEKFTTDKTIEFMRENRIQTGSIRIGNETAAINALYEEGTAESVDAATARVTALRKSVEEIEDPHIKQQLQLELDNQFGTTIAAVVRRESQDRKLARAESAEELYQSIDDIVNRIGPNSTMEDIILAYRAINGYNANLKKIDPKNWAKTADIRLWKEKIKEATAHAFKRSILESADAETEYRHNPVEARTDPAALVAVAAATKLTKRDIKGIREGLRAIGAEPGSSYYTQIFNDSKIDKALQVAEAGQIEQINYYLSRMDAAGDNNVEREKVRVEKIKYLENIRPVILQTLKNNGWTDVQMREKFADAWIAQWDDLEKRADDEIRRNVAVKKENNARLYSDRRRDRKRAKTPIDQKMSDALIISGDEVDVLIRAAQPTEDYGTEGYFNEQNDDAEYLKNIVAHNHLLDFFIRNGTFDGAIQYVNDNPEMGESGYYDTVNLKERLRVIQDKYKLMDDDEKSAWMLQLGGGSPVNISQVRTEGEAQQWTESQIAHEVVRRVHEQYANAAKTLRGTAVGDILANSFEDGVPLNSEQWDYINDTMESLQAENNHLEITKLYEAIQGNVIVDTVPTNTVQSTLLTRGEFVGVPWMRDSDYKRLAEGSGPFAAIRRKTEVEFFRAVYGHSDENRGIYAHGATHAIIAPFMQRYLLATEEKEKANILEEAREATKEVVMEDGTPVILGRQVNPNYIFQVPGTEHYDPNALGVHQRLGTEPYGTFIRYGDYSYTDQLRLKHKHGDYRYLFISTYDRKTETHLPRVAFDKDNKEHMKILKNMLALQGLNVNVKGTDLQNDEVEFSVNNGMGFEPYKYMTDKDTYFGIIYEVPIKQSKRRDSF